MKTITQLIAAAACAATMATAQAASLTLNYVGDNDVDSNGTVIARAGDLLTFELTMDFTDAPILGGGFDVNYDASGLEYVSYVTAQLGAAWARRTPDVFVGLLESGAFGALSGNYGPDLVATMTFRMTASEGLFFIGPSATNGVAGPFVSAIDLVSIIEPDFFGVTVRAVPIPAALWLLGCGLLALVSVGRRQ